MPALLVLALACSSGQRKGADSASATGDTTAAADTVAAPVVPAPLDIPGDATRPRVTAPASAAKTPQPPAAVPPAAARAGGGGTFGPKDGLHIDPARPPRDPALPRPPLLSTQKVSSQTVASLEADARALANTAGCERASQCRTAPVGAKGCGGPRTYLVYCPLTTDTAALFRKLAELERAERELNRRNNVVSTCEFMMPPSASIEAGRCAAPRRAP